MEGQLKEPSATTPMARLLHRWFVEYNPFYLCSATLVLVGTWRARTRIFAVPPVVCLVHGVLAAGLVPMPHSLVGWGSTIIGLGFALLFASLAASYGLRNTSITRPSSS